MSKCEAESGLRVLYWFCMSCCQPQFPVMWVQDLVEVVSYRFRMSCRLTVHWLPHREVKERHDCSSGDADLPIPLETDNEQVERVTERELVLEKERVGGTERERERDRLTL